MHNLCRIRGKAGNMLKKTVNGKTTTFAFDDANQLVSSTTDGVTTRYAYDAAGRMVREGNKTYRYGYLDKVLSVTDGDTTRTFTYHADGQLASATVGSALRADRGATPLSETETFLWDGLALIQRGDEQFINEPHVGGGNPVASSKGTSYFNDMLGTTVGSKSNGKYSAAALTAFGEGTDADKAFFTGKPMVEGLGHAFLMRNYRAGLAKWQTADPMGYPDGWNQMAYCNNRVASSVDLFGCSTYGSEDVESEWYTINANTVIDMDSTLSFTAEQLAALTPNDRTSLRVIANSTTYHDVYQYDTEEQSYIYETAAWGYRTVTLREAEYERISYVMEITVEYINKARNNQISEAATLLGAIGMILSKFPKTKHEGTVMSDIATLAGLYAYIDNKLHPDDVLTFDLGMKIKRTDQKEKTMTHVWWWYE